MYNYSYIKRMRDTRGLTMLQASKLLNMDTGNYNRLEKGRYKDIPLELLKSLQKQLGIDLYYLLNIRPLTPGTVATASITITTERNNN